MGWVGVIDRVRVTVWIRVRVRFWIRVLDRVRVREMVMVTVGVIFFDGKIKTENGILF